MRQNNTQNQTYFTRGEPHLEPVKFSKLQNAISHLLFVTFTNWFEHSTPLDVFFFETLKKWKIQKFYFSV